VSWAGGRHASRIHTEGFAVKLHLHTHACLRTNPRNRYVGVGAVIAHQTAPAKVELAARQSCSLTYSKSMGLPSMPLVGAAIQLANLPGS